MASVHDVAAYILSKQDGPISTWKLQKLVYYSQAWHLAWEQEPLFPEVIEAWANGPTVFELFDLHRGKFSVLKWDEGDPSNLTMSQKSVIDAVLEFYGDKSGSWLRELTHMERPWQSAREGLTPTARSTKPIDLDEMLDYYSGLASSV
jgi:uncharacterized phage-associated protein